MDIIEAAEVFGEIARKHPHGAGDNTVFKGWFFAVADIREVVEFFFGFGESSVDVSEDLGHVETGAAVELGGKTDFDIAHPFSKVVASEFIRATFEGFACLEDGDGILEAAQIFAKVGVTGLKYGLFESLFGVGGQRNFLLLGEFDQCFDTDRSV